MSWFKGSSSAPAADKSKEAASVLSNNNAIHGREGDEIIPGMAEKYRRPGRKEPGLGIGNRRTHFNRGVNAALVRMGLPNNNPSKLNVPQAAVTRKMSREVDKMMKLIQTPEEGKTQQEVFDKLLPETTPLKYLLECALDKQGIKVRAKSMWNTAQEEHNDKKRNNLFKGGRRSRKARKSRRRSRRD